VVLTGAGRFFSAGLDLASVVAMDRATLGGFLDGFEKMALAWFLALAAGDPPRSTGTRSRAARSSRWRPTSAWRAAASGRSV